MRDYSCHFVLYVIGILLLVGILNGIAAADIALTPHLTLGNMYTDNIDLTSDKEHDFITMISPGIDCSMTRQFSSLSLSYTPTYASYLRFPENSTLRHRGDLSASTQIASETQLEFSNNFLYTEDPLSDIDTTIRQGRNAYTTNTTSLGMTNRFGPEDSVALGYEYYFLSNTDPTVEDNDYHRPRITINYWIVPNRYGTESEVRYTKTTYDDSEDYTYSSGRFRLIRRIGPHFDVYAEYTHGFTNYSAEGEDYRIHSPLVGFDWSEYSNYSLSASFGYFFRNSDQSGEENGPVGMIRSLYSWDPGASLSITGRAGYDLAVGDAENLGFNQFYDVSCIIGYPLGRNLNGNLFAAYRWDIYTDAAPDQDTTLMRTGAGLSYQPLPWMTVNMNYMYRKLDSNLDSDNYEENRAEITLTLTPQQPIMF